MSRVSWMDRTSCIGGAARRQTANCRTLEINEVDRKRRCAGAWSEVSKVQTSSGVDVGDQILLSEFEFIEITIFNGIRFVQVILAPEILATVSNVTDLDHRVLGQFALNTESIRVDITKFQIRNKRIYRICQRRRKRIDYRRRNVVGRRDCSVAE